MEFLASFDQLVTRVKQTREANNQWPLLISFVGKPGAGKTFLASKLAAALEDAVVVPMDGFHFSNKVLLERNLRNEKGSLNTFDVEGFCCLVKRIAASKASPVYFPVFHREIEESIAAEGFVRPEDKFVIFEGIWLFHDLFKEARDIFHVRVFIDVESDDERIERLVQRWLPLGKTREEALAWATGPDEKNAIIIETTRQHAQFIFRNSSCA